MKTFSKSLSKFFFALILVATISFSINFSSYAQNTSLGIKGGVNLANFRGEDVKDFDNRTAFNFGLVLNYSIAESAGLSLEADYASMGATYDGSILGISTGKYTTKLDYLRTTLLLNYYMGSSEMNIRPELFAGPYLGFLLDGQSKFEDGDYSDVKNSYESTDFGAVFGAGLHLKIKEGIWLVPDVRYNLGLSDITKGTIFGNNSTRNGVLSVNLGVTFPLN
jgi:outer membrane protein W